MAVLFLGDIAVPRRALVAAATPVPALAPAQFDFAVANLEGPLRDQGDAPVCDGGPFNHPSIVDYLGASRIRVVNLANNHAFAEGDTLADTVGPLRSAGLFPVGAGETLAQASAAVRVPYRGSSIHFMGFGWSSIGCRPATRSTPGVNPLEPAWLLSRVREARAQLGTGERLVLLCHWNYELEAYPQPMHRQLAHAAAEAGADLIVGCHSHCAAGVEKVNGSWIVHGLGNWLLPSGEFMGGRLRFPARASLQLAFRWDPESNAGCCDWFSYDQTTHELQAMGSGEPLTCERTRALTPFAGMSHEQYLRWFRDHRHRRRLLPVFEDMNTPRLNHVKHVWVQVRHSLITTLVSLGLKDAGPSTNELRLRGAEKGRQSADKVKARRTGS